MASNFSDPDISEHFRITILDGDNCAFNYNDTRDVTTEYFYSTKIVLGILGFIFNLVSTLIFGRVKRRSVFLLLLLHLSVVEVVFNATGVIFELFYYLLIVRGLPLMSSQAAQVIGYSVFFVVYIAYKSSLLTRNWLIVFIAWRRYRAIKEPIKTNQVFSNKFVNRGVALLYTLAMLVTIPRTLEVTYTICFENGQMRPKATFLLYTDFVAVYRTFFFICTSPLPIAGVVVCSLCLLLILYRRDQSIEAMTSQSPQRRSSLRIVIILCGIFGLCEMPMFLAGLFNRLAEESADIKVALVGLANILTNLDSILNFIVYYSSLSCFKSAFQINCCRQSRQNPSPDRNTACTIDRWTKRSFSHIPLYKINNDSFVCLRAANASTSLENDDL